MNKYLAVLAGGALGSLLRYLAQVEILKRFPMPFPLGTFLINVSGSFLIGVLMTLFAGRLSAYPNWRLFLVVGFLGGYTTFSSFEWETLAASRDGSPLLALSYVLSSVIAGYAAVLLGASLAGRS